MSNIIHGDVIDKRKERIIREAEATKEAMIQERNAAERQIVGLIVQIAKAHDALEDLAAITDVTIPNLEALAISKGVMPDSTEWLTLITSITPLKWQLEAIEDTTWAECWAGLKSRFQEYLAEIARANAEAQAE